MNKFLLLSIFSVVKSEVDIEWFVGKRYPVVQYPQPMLGPICQTIDFQLKNNVNCTCGDRGVVPVVEHVINTNNNINLPGNLTQTYRAPVIIVESSAEVVNALEIQCKCNEKDEHHEVYRKINENVFVVYDKPFYLSFYKGESNKALVIVKKVPKLSQLREVLKNIDDLNQREPAYLCEPNYFINEFEDLD